MRNRTQQAIREIEADFRRAADPENAVICNYFNLGDATITGDKAANVGNIGRPRAKPLFEPKVIDRMICVPDAAIYATNHFLVKLLYPKPGGSTGTNVYDAFQFMAELNAQGQ